MSLVGTAEAAAREAGARRVRALHLQLGALSGVVRDALDFAYDIATEGTLLEGSTLVVEDVPVVVHCPTCDAERTLPTITRFRCPVCETPTPDVRRGRELIIDHLEIEPGEVPGVPLPAPPPADAPRPMPPRPMPPPPWRR